MRPAFAAWLVVAGLAFALLPREATASEAAQNATIFGPTNPLLADGARALEEGRIEEGIRLTHEGLQRPNLPRDEAAGYSNLCAGYATLRRWDEALAHCNKSLTLDPNNWRTFNNRAAVHVGKGEFERAIEDVEAGLEIAPESSTLKRTLQIVHEHRRVHEERRRTAVKA